MLQAGGEKDDRRFGGLVSYEVSTNTLAWRREAGELARAGRTEEASANDL